MNPYAIRNPANVSASEMMKIHIMNLLHDVPNGDFPPPQSDARIRCCSAKLASIQISYNVRGQKARDYANTSKTNKYTHKASMKCQYVAQSFSDSSLRVNR